MQNLSVPLSLIPIFLFVAVIAAPVIGGWSDPVEAAITEAAIIETAITEAAITEEVADRSASDCGDPSSPADCSAGCPADCSAGLLGDAPEK